ncbi:MAG: class I SAM-dependent methyltransferase [Candidatus Nanopelagicales bacterium]|jgi:2-polyprenyl-3-methyl-5-hydroxy-6-metoxy-1,4-benzoquinol methylase|nr:class I SAM-dependent methyltransferase [Candidatus Nanopelagicales bacterium]
MDLKEEEILGADVGSHWYYRSKSEALQRLIAPYATGGPVLDVGAGSGFFAKELVAAGATRSVTCVDPGYVEEHDEHLPGGIVRFRRSVTASDADLALFMDVLEHVDDDAGLLAEYRTILGPGKLVAVTVPAFAFLWSGHDVFLEHRRRYTLRTLERAMRDGGLTVVQSNYFFGGVFPVAAAIRLADRTSRDEPRSSLRRHAPGTNRLLTAVCRAETRVQRHNRLAGLSCFAVGVTRA